MLSVSHRPCDPVSADSVQRDLLVEIAEMRHMLAEALEANQLTCFEKQWRLFAAKALHNVERGRYRPGEITALRSLLQQVETIFKSAAEWERQSDAIVERHLTKTRHYLDSQGPAILRRHSFPTPAAYKPKAQATPAPAHTNSHANPAILVPYRAWFLDNFAAPFVTDPGVKKGLMERTGHTASQLANWFVNARRRSGWGELYRLYGSSNKDDMQAFLTLCDSETTSWQVSQEARDKVAKVRAWFGADKDRVRTDIREVVELAQEELLMKGGEAQTKAFSGRALATAAKRKSADDAQRYGQPSHHSDYMAPTITQQPTFFALPPAPHASPQSTNSSASSYPSSYPSSLVDELATISFAMPATHGQPVPAPGWINEPRSHFSLDSTSTFFASQSPMVLDMSVPYASMSAPFAATTAGGQ